MELSGAMPTRISLRSRSEGRVPYHLQSPATKGFRAGLAEAGFTEAVFVGQVGQFGVVRISPGNRGYEAVKCYQ